MALEEHTCATCAEEVEAGHPWVIFGRYGIGDGRSYVLSEVQVNGQHQWHTTEGDADDEDRITGHIFHWPDCAFAWVEARMVELGHRARSGQE